MWCGCGVGVGVGVGDVVLVWLGKSFGLSKKYRSDTFGLASSIYTGSLQP